MNRSKIRLFFCFLLLCPFFLFAQAASPVGAVSPAGTASPVGTASPAGTAPHNPALAVGPEDIRIEQGTDGGFHLFIRKKPGMGSVLLTESTRDPALKSANYAYRAPEWNPVNGDEIRLLDGKPIPKAARLWSLIDSTPEFHPELGEVFHIYIPYILYYGYEDSRHGEVYITAGTYLNIRAFSLPYADYRGSFRDNPFVLDVIQEASPVPSGNYMKETVEAFVEINSWGGGTPSYSVGPGDIVDRIKDMVNREQGKTMDIVICLDTTGSMKNDMEAIRKNLVPMLGENLGGKSCRIGMLLFKDYYEDYLTRVVPFTTNLNDIQRTLNGIVPRGGKDIPEAVHEGLYDSAVKFPWEAETRLIILIGDAPPHLRPRGKITGEMVRAAAAERNIKIQTIILPQ